MKKNAVNVSDFTPGMLDRRMTIERRKFTYANCIPERRSGVDRRCLGSATYHSGAMIGTTDRVKWGYCQ
ncbi:hypothetical protein [Desulfosarcina variabilis]|uniref:hypothetical protein n=1 Tax=Desulfosarcina variabilis TaxID=2300 RepID=UPI003AFB0697